jgi:hypothetical protein
MATTSQANIKAVITADDRASATLKGFGSNVNDAAKKVAIGLTAAGAALTYFAKQSADFSTDYLKSSRDISRETGVSITEASRLTYVTGKLGISTEEASQIFGIFSKKIKESTKNTEEGQAAQAGLNQDIEKTKLEIAEVTRELDKNSKEIKKNGDKSGDLKFKSEQLKFRLKELNGELGNLSTKLTEAKSPFERIGIATTDASGNMRGFTDILFDVADKFQKMPDGIDKTALSLELFGRSGKDMLPVLNQGSEGIRNLQGEADKLGVTLNEKTIGSLSRLIESQKLLKTSTDSLKLAVGEATAPILTAFNTKISEILQNLLNADPATRNLTAGILAFGGPVLTASGALIAFSANLVTTIDGMNKAIAAAGGLRAALAALTTPFIITLAVAAALVSIGLVYAAVRSVIDAIDAMNKAAQSEASFQKTKDQSVKQIQTLIKQYRAAGDQAGVDRATKNLKAVLETRATGGPVSQGTPYLVGERGPEVFMPNKSGNIVSNDKLGHTVHIHINAGAYMGSQQDARKYAEMIMNAYNDLKMSRSMT